MDLFEFILIITSVVYALALAQLLMGVGRLAHTEALIRWYVPHTVWLVNFFLAILLSWWAGWEFRQVDWTFPKFTYLFISPIFIFFATTLAVPQRMENQEVNLERHFIRVRRLALWSFFAVLLAQFIDGSVLANEKIVSLSRIPQLAVLSAIVAGTITENKRLQSALSIGVLGFLLFVIVVRFWLPA